MSNDPKIAAEAMRVLREVQSGPGATVRGPGLNGRQVDAKTLAFQAEMRMAQQALASGSPEEGQSASSFDMGMISDAMLMDALSTIARLTGQDLPGRKSAPVSEPLENALTRNPQTQGLGSLAAKFESGEKGAAAIGYDRTGGTSYGTFQISSRAGTMARFLNFLGEHEPAWAERLRAAGPANTGSIKGRMPAEWARIASESPERFERLQAEFIKKDHYQPAREKIRELTGVDIEKTRPALREALFSTAVQHGANGAARIFGQAIDKFLGRTDAEPAAAPAAKGFEQALVSEVYDRRQHQFGGSTSAVRASVRGRLRQEKDMVLAMLENKGMNRIV